MTPAIAAPKISSNDRISFTFLLALAAHALIILGVGWYLAQWVSGSVTRFLRGKSIDITLARFLGSAVKLAILSVVVVIALSNLGISITPLIRFYPNFVNSFTPKNMVSKWKVFSDFYSEICRRFFIIQYM